MSRRITSSRRVPRDCALLLNVLWCAELLTGCVGSEDKPSEEAPKAKPVAVAPAPAAARSDCPVAAAVNQDITLYKRCSPYMQPGGGIDVVNGATLTIEAGVELRFKDKDWMEIGAGGEPGRLIAKGTAEEPIILTTESPDTEPTWLGLWFHSGTLPGSVLSHAVVRQAGGNNRHSKPNLLHGCVTLTGVKSGALSIADLQVEKCINGGVRLTNSQVGLSGVRFVDTALGFAVDAASAGQITEQAQYSGVTYNLLRGGPVAADARWVSQGIPYVVDADVDVQGPNAPKLTLAPGLELEFEKDRALRVGVAQPGSLRAEGTREAPIKLSANGADQTWNGVQLLGQTSAGTRLAFVEVSGAAGEGAVALHAQPGRVEIKDSKFSGNAVDVLVGCDAKPVLGKNQYTSPRGLTRAAPCK